MIGCLQWAMTGLSLKANDCHLSYRMQRYHAVPSKDTDNSSFIDIHEDDELHSSLQGENEVNIEMSSRSHSSIHINNKDKSLVNIEGYEDESHIALMISDDHMPQTKVTSGSTTLQMIIAWISLLLAILSLATVGPAFKYITSQGVHSLQASAWRGMTMSMCLLPMTLIEYYSTAPNQRSNWFQIHHGFDYPAIVYVIWSGILWAMNLILWIIGLSYTTAMRASLYSSLYPLIMVVYLYLIGDKVSQFEWIGVITSLIGIGIASYRGIILILHEQSNNELLTFFGDFLAFLAAFMQFAGILNKSRVKNQISIVQYTFLTTVVVTIVSAGASVGFELNSNQIFCLESSCLFGWLSKEWFGFMMVFGLYVGVIGICGFNYALDHISPLVFSSACLLDPAVTGLISWMTGIEPFPSAEIWAGFFVTVFGIGMVTYGEKMRDHKTTALPSHPEDGSL